MIVLRAVLRAVVAFFLAAGVLRFADVSEYSALVGFALGVVVGVAAYALVSWADWQY